MLVLFALRPAFNYPDSMFSKPIVIALVVILLSCPVSAQSGNQVESEAQLAFVLCNSSANAESVDALIKGNLHLVNARLWKNLINRAAAAYYNQPPDKSLAIYELALKVAKQLDSNQLLATTYYNLGRTYSGLNKFSKAIDAYENSRRSFRDA